MTHITALLHLRIIVLTLGEQHHSRWWRSQFLAPTGLSFLERLYPRSAFTAAVRSATRAASEAHDAAIGQGDVAHPAAPATYSGAIARAATATHTTQLANAYYHPLTDRAALLTRLETLAEDFEIQSLAGPIRLTPEEPEDLVPALAAIYYQAFQTDKPVYPYFLPKFVPLLEVTT
ncbi:MAG: BrxE family protein [Chloroflexi bacterium]|nr:BrxE family protein [Chloroflexota bacterium]